MKLTERHTDSEFSFLGHPRTVVELEFDAHFRDGKEVDRSLERLNSVLTFYSNGAKRDWILFDLHDGSLFSLTRYRDDGTVAEVIDDDANRPASSNELPESLGFDLPTAEEAFERDEVGNWIKSTVTVRTHDLVSVYVTRRIIHYF